VWGLQPSIVTARATHMAGELHLASCRTPATELGAPPDPRGSGRRRTLEDRRRADLAVHRHGPARHCRVGRKEDARLALRRPAVAGHRGEGWCGEGGEASAGGARATDGNRADEIFFAVVATSRAHGGVGE